MHKYFKLESTSSLFYLSMKQKQKRYQYWSKDGIKWTEWFNVPMDTPEEKWQVKNKLLNEYRIIDL